MKKRIISMALSLLMLFTAIATASCGEEEKSDGTLTLGGDTGNAMTLSIWGIKGEGTTDEAVAMVEAAMSKITQAQFNTAIDLILYEEDEYYDAVTAKIDEIQSAIDAKEAAEAERKKAEREAKKRGETLAATEAVETEETEAATDETVLDEYGLPTTLYPPVEDDQLDIFLITDYEMLSTMYDKEALSILDEQLTGNAKLLKQYIHPTLIDAGKMNGTAVAIPNQQLIGEYTYMLLNKALIDKYSYNIDNIATLQDAYYFIRDVAAYEPSYQALVGDTTPINVNYFAPDGQKTVVGNMLNVDKKYGDAFYPRFLFGVTNWSRWIKLCKNLENYNCIGSETFSADDKFGVGIMKGTAADLADYNENYYAVVLQAPQGTVENVYNGMFAVSTYTKSADRAMEILTYLNTRSDLRNLFGYGIEGVHYSVSDDGVVKKLNGDYNMKLEYTGNCFMAYVPEGYPTNYWEIAKAHNIDLALSPYIQFEITDEILEENNLTELYEYVVEFSNNFYDALAKAKTEAAVEQVLDYYWELCEEDEKMSLWINEYPEVPEGEEVPNTMRMYYDQWFDLNR